MNKGQMQILLVALAALGAQLAWGHIGAYGPHEPAGYVLFWTSIVTFIISVL